MSEALKVTTFKGIAPRVSPELLPDGVGQTARNVKTFSGDLIPYPVPYVAGSTGRTGVIRTIYPLVDPDTDELVWLSWGNVVNVATPANDATINQQRFYYSGDGVPKVSTYALATSGGAPYPNDYYELGLPLPDNIVTAVAASFSAKTISSVARDSGGLVTFVTSTAHGLRSGMVAAVKGFSHIVGTYDLPGSQTNTVTINNHGIANGSTVYLTKVSGDMTDGAYVVSSAATNTFTVTDPVSATTSGSLKLDMRSFNTIGSEVIRVDDTTFKMFLPGFEMATYTVTGATVELSGQTYARTYTYTWLTPWGEESIGAEPSDDLILKAGQTVTVSGLPTAPPLVPTKNFIRGMNLYRSSAGLQVGSFLKLKTLWFPQTTASVARAGAISTVVTTDPHNFIPDDRFKLTGCSDATFDITGGIVIDVPDVYTFTYAQAGTDVTETADLTGVLYHDVAENPDDDARYWGASGFDFTDDFDDRSLTDILLSTEYDAPPEDLEGLVAVQNNILVGFVGNKLYVSEPNKPHAWPEAYVQTLDATIISVQPLSGIGTVVVTNKYPYLVTGNDPASFNIQRVDALYPCVSAQGVVVLNHGVMYPTQEGLALYSAAAGPRLATTALFNEDTWTDKLDPTTIVAAYYSNAYFASHDEGSFVFTYDAENGGVFVDCDQTFTAAYNDAANDKMYFVSGTDGTVYQWDNSSQQAQVQEWKSKVLIFPDYTNLGAARVIADWGEPSEPWATYSQPWATTTIPWAASSGLIFTLWANKQQVFSAEIFDSEIFRLPKGYRSDTYEFSIEGDIRVRAVHLGQTPLTLKGV